MNARNRMVTGVLTIAIAATSWWVWKLTGTAIRGIFLDDFRFLVSLVAVLAFLTLAEIVVSRAVARLTVEARK